MKDPYEHKPWLKNYDKHVPEKLIYPDKLYTDLFHEAVEEMKDKVAIYYADMPITFAELDTMSNKFANFLKEQGMKQGDVVGIHMPNVLANFISVLGTLKAGCVVSGVSPLLTPRELEYQLNNSGAAALVTIDLLWGNVSPIIGKTGVKTIAMASVADFLLPVKKVLGKLLKKIPHIEVTPIEGVPMHNYMDILKNMPATPTILNMSTDSTCMMQYTGGTTGVPKGAIITHKNFVSELVQFTVWGDNEKGAHVTLSAMPLFHMGGLITSLWQLANGSTQIAVPNPRDIASFIKAIDKYKPTTLINVPTIYIELMKQPAFRKLDFSQLRWCLSGAAPFAPENIKELESLIGPNKIIETMGMTETSAITMAHPSFGKKKVGSAGLPFPDMEIRVVDPVTRELVPQGERGEMVVKGPTVFKGYHNMPEETAKTLRDGWIYTGDIVYMDEDGYFFVVDRSKDMIIVSGYKVFTRELDDIISEHPDVAMAATIGTPNPDRLGAEIVTTAVVLKPGVEKSDATRNSIIDFVRENAAPYKVPKKVIFMDQLPTSAVGKILKRELREILKS